MASSIKDLILLMLFAPSDEGVVGALEPIGEAVPRALAYPAPMPRSVRMKAVCDLRLLTTMAARWPFSATVWTFALTNRG